MSLPAQNKRQIDHMAKTFEASLDELEEIVKKLENGDLPLEESLALFERGVRLSRDCRERLASAERKIQVLIEEANGELALEDVGE